MKKKEEKKKNKKKKEEKNRHSSVLVGIDGLKESKSDREVR